MDNAGRYTTGRIRGGAMIYADSLFHNRDKMSIGSYFSGGATSPFFDYNIPVNKKDGRVGFLFTSTFAKLKYGSLCTFRYPKPRLSIFTVLFTTVG